MSSTAIAVSDRSSASSGIDRGAGLRNALPRVIAFAGALLFAAILWSLPAAAVDRYSVALIIGNQNYGDHAPHVDYAHNDAEAMKTFVIDRLGFRPGNVQVIKDATLGKMREWFGTRDKPGRLWDWVREGRSNVFVYYSGHGAPDITSPLERKPAYLIPVDVDPNTAANGYSLAMLQSNLSALKRHLGSTSEVVLMLDACFSGQSAKGAVGDTKGGFVPDTRPIVDDVIVMSATRATEVAFWNDDKRLGLFTSTFVDGIAGGADGREFGGNGDGKVTWQELARYIGDEVPYQARRSRGLNQTPQLPVENGPSWEFDIGETDAIRRNRLCREEPARWQALKADGNAERIQASRDSFDCPEVRREIEDWISANNRRLHQPATATDGRSGKSILQEPLGSSTLNAKCSVVVQGSSGNSISISGTVCSR